MLLVLLLFFFRVLDTMRLPSSKLRVVTLSIMFSKLSMSVINCGRTVGPSVEGILLGVALDGLIVIGIIYHDASKKNTKEGREYGSSRKGDIFKEASKNDALENKIEAKRDEDANIILSKNVKVDMDTWHTGINDNIFVVRWVWYW